MHCVATLTSLALLAPLASCQLEVSTHSTSQSVSSRNALSYNRLSYNRLSYNRLSYNPLAGPDLEETEDGRELLSYVVRCALGPDEGLVASDDGNQFDMPGALGLAPEWKNRPLDDDERYLISACLLAHVNAYGVSVPISVRAVDSLEASRQS